MSRDVVFDETTFAYKKGELPLKSDTHRFIDSQIDVEITCDQRRIVDLSAINHDQVQTNITGKYQATVQEELAKIKISANRSQSFAIRQPTPARVESHMISRPQRRRRAIPVVIDKIRKFQH